MTIRRLALPADLDTLYNLLTESYHYPENPEWNAEEEDFALRDAGTGQVVAMGTIMAQTRPGDRHRFSMNVGPEHARLVPFLISYMLHRVRSRSASHVVSTELWEWRYFALEDHEKAGFTKGKESHRLGIKL